MENIPFPYRITSVQTARSIILQKDEEEKLRKMVDAIVIEKINLLKQDIIRDISSEIRGQISLKKDELIEEIKHSIKQELKNDFKHDFKHDEWEKVNIEKQN